MTTVAWGATLGLMFGISALLLGSWAAARRAPRLAARIRPFVGPAGAGLDAGGDGLVAGLLALVTPTIHGEDQPDLDLALRLQRAGSPVGPEQFRLERLIWCALGASAGAALGALVGAGGAPIATSAVLAGVGGVAGWWLAGVRLDRAIRRRQESIERHLPTLVDLLALAIASGAAPITALERAGATMTGPLADETARTAADARSGIAVDAALRAMALRIGVPSVQRFVDGVVVALERGTPVVEVVRAQASDVRAAESRRLMEVAGRKDVAMLVPIVFLVLPSVVLIAIFPGVQALHLVVP
jgi:tight adherence protein C